jgi:hypothetical protein
VFGKVVPEFENFKRAVRPIVFPADDEVGLPGVVVVLEKVAAFNFKFDFDELAFVVADATHGFTVGETGLKAEHDEAELPAHSAE